MSAETLRRAAALMRKRAERTTPGPWGYSSKWTTQRTALTRITRSDVVVAEARNEGAGIRDLDHLASWHPAVALAVADWLDAEALDAEGRERSGRDRTNCDVEVYISPLVLAVARAYLGEAS